MTTYPKITNSYLFSKFEITRYQTHDTPIYGAECFVLPVKDNRVWSAPTINIKYGSEILKNCSYRRFTGALLYYKEYLFNFSSLYFFDDDGLIEKFNVYSYEIYKTGSVLKDCCSDKSIEILIDCIDKGEEEKLNISVEPFINELILL